MICARILFSRCPQFYKSDEIWMFERTVNGSPKEMERFCNCSTRNAVIFFLNMTKPPGQLNPQLEMKRNISQDETTTMEV